MIKFENIIKFLSLFMSGDLKLKNESPDYIMEKFEKYFGKDIEIKKSNCVTSLYEKHNKIWNHNDYRINSIFNFFYGVHSWSRDNNIEVNWKRVPQQASLWHSYYNSGINNILCNPEVIVQLFNENIGNFSDIHDEDNDGLHPLIKRDIFNVYFDSTEKDNELYFLKLERKEKLNKINKQTQNTKYK